VSTLLARSILILGALGFLAGVFYSGFFLDEYKLYSSQILVFADRHYLIFPVFFTFTFIIATVLGLPGGAIFCVLSGYFFGLLAGLFVSMMCLSISAVSVWIVVRYSHIDIVNKFFMRLELDANVLRKDFWFQFSIRLIPVFPFYAVNFLLAKSQAHLGTYFFAALLGTLPTAFAFASLGAGLQTLGDVGDFSINSLRENYYYLISVSILAILCVTAIVVKRRFDG